MTGREERISLRAALLFRAFSLLPLKRMFANPERFSKAMDRAARKPAPLPGRALRREFAVSHHGGPGESLIRLSPRGRAPTGEIFFIHGGAFAFEINSLHWRFLARLVERTGHAVSAVLYPLLGTADGVAITAHVNRSFQAACKIMEGRPVCLMGDSAGACLALALAQRLAKDPSVDVASLVLLSPWLDLELDQLSHRTLDAADPLLALPGLKFAARRFAAGRPLRSPEVSPLQGNMLGLPPALVMTGGRDLLHCDAQRFVQAAAADGASVILKDPPAMVHNWMQLPIPEARGALDDIANFIVTAQRGKSSQPVALAG